MRRRTGLLLAGSLLLAAAATLGGCASIATSTHGAVNVVAGEDFWGSVAAQIGGPHVRVTSIITNPNADPHLYESSPANAAAVAAARVVIVNGAGYDDFMSQLLSAAGKRPTVVDAATVLGVTGNDPNPHLWYDIPRVPLVAGAIERALAHVDPRFRSTFAANLARFDASLHPILAVLARIRARFAGAPVAYTERVPGYLLAVAGLTVKTPPGFARAIEQGTQPGPGDTESMDALLTGHRIRVLLYNVQTVSAVTTHVRQLALQHGVPVVGVSETLPTRYPTYQAWQLAQAQAILAALEHR